MYNLNITIITLKLQSIYSTEDHDIIKPPSDIKSKFIKKTNNNILKISQYNDLDIENKNKVEEILKKYISCKSIVGFLKETNQLTKKYRYFIQTDLIGAYFNFSFQNIFNILKLINNEFVYNYLSGFYNYIRQNYETDEYLYICDYSEFIFSLFLQNIFKNQNIIFKVDDIILYGDDILELKKTLKELSNLLSEYSLYFNTKKTFYIDIFYDSIYIFKTIVSVPKCNSLDNKLINQINTLIKNGDVINIYDFNDQLYNYIHMLKNDILLSENFPHLIIKIEVYKNIWFFKKIFYKIYNHSLKSININNNFQYTSLLDLLRDDKNIFLKTKAFDDDYRGYS